MPAAALDQVQAAVRGIWTAADTCCHACGREIHLGHTAFFLKNDVNTIYTTCWECGEAILQHLGFAVAAEFPTTPPYGGGRNRPPGASTNNHPTSPHHPAKSPTSPRSPQFRTE